MYTMGNQHLILATDHQPLTRILNDRTLDTISNPRLLKLKEKTLMYNYHILHVPGKSQAMATADGQSRNPSQNPSDSNETEEFENTARSFAIYQAEQAREAIQANGHSIWKVIIF